MSVWSRSTWSPGTWSRRTRWAVPVGIVTALATAAVVVPGLATANPALPTRTAAELLVNLSDAELQPLSGTVVQTARLGLPELPVPPGGTSLAALAAGSTTVRVWYGGPDQVRLALVGPLAETDVIRSGADAWLWTSDTNTAEHLTLPETGPEMGPEIGPGPAPTPPVEGGGLTPREAAERALALIDPSTAVSVDGTAEVAGRAVYSLLLRPRDAGSLVREVRVAVDSETWVPLQVQVLAKGASEPAFETGFTAITFEDPADSVFSFTPPPGATVREHDLGEHMSPAPGEPGDPGDPGDPGEEQTRGGAPRVIGQGWTSVVVLTGATDLVSASTNPQISALLQAAEPVTGPYGSGRLLRTALVCVLLLDDGRVFIGAVTSEVLEAAASDTPATAANDTAAIDTAPSDPAAAAVGS